MSELTVTNHAQLRMAQRNVTWPQLCFILEHGQRIRRAGVSLVYLRHKDIPTQLLAQNQFASLEGTAVVLNRQGTIVMTIWRNRAKGLRHIMRKPGFGY